MLVNVSSPDGKQKIINLLSSFLVTNTFTKFINLPEIIITNPGIDIYQKYPLLFTEEFKNF